MEEGSQGFVLAVGGVDGPEESLGGVSYVCVFIHKHTATVSQRHPQVKTNHRQ